MSGRKTILLFIIVITIFIISIAVIGYNQGKGLGLPDKISVGLLVVIIAFIIILLFFVTLPACLVASYQKIRYKTLLQKIEEDLWLCGLPFEHIQTKLKEFESKNNMTAFMWPTTIMSLFLLAMWGLVLAPNGLSGLWVSLYEQQEPVKTELGTFWDVNNQQFFDYLTNNASLVTWTFLGTYFYVINILIRRWLLSDLTTGVLWKINIRFAISFIIGFLLIAIWTETEVAIAIAFFTGIIPEATLNWVKNTVTAALNLDGEYRKLFEPSNLQQTITGLSFWQIERLADEGIDNVQNLATKEIPDLLIQTRFDTQCLLQWIDQSILVNQLDQTEKDTKIYSHFKKAFIQTASDLMDRTTNNHTVLNKETLKEVLKSLETNNPNVEDPKNGESKQQSFTIKEEMLTNLIVSLQQGPNLVYIQAYWTHTRTPIDRQNRLEKLKEEKKRKTEEAS